MAIQKLIENSTIVRIECMSVAGGTLGLENGFKYYVNLELDYEGLEASELMQLASEGSSVRVKAQAKLRALGDKVLQDGGAVKAESAGEVKADALGTFKYNVATDFESERGGPRDPKKQALSGFQKSDDEGKIEIVMTALGCTREEAIKHLGDKIQITA